MASEIEQKRKIEALKAIYRTKNKDLSDEEAQALANHLGNGYFKRSAMLLALLFLLLVAFLVWRFVL